MKYRLIAIDVDGTLVNPDQTVSPEVVAAVAAAQEAGMFVCLATGRSYVETMPVWRQLRLREPFEPMVLIGGALVSEPDTGRTLYQRAIAMDHARPYAQALNAAGYSAMAIVDVWRHGVDYFIVESADADEVMRRWFSQMKVQTRRVKSLDDVPDMPLPLRINAVVDPRDGAALAEKLAAQFAGSLNVHSIVAPNYGITIVEAFAAATTKWTALQYVAQGMGIAPAEIVAIGDDVNDLSMIRAAGLGVAMPWAPPVVRQAAKAVAEPSLAKFIEQLVASSQ